MATTEEARDLCSHLSNLYVAEASRNAANAYLREHGRPEAVKHHVNVFCWYKNYLPASGAFLDWGCNHGPDSCLLRRTFGPSADLYGCDFVPEEQFGAFRESARIKYTQLTESLEMPYADRQFDAVVGSGVLEHSAMDGEALKQIYRILKPGGIFVISYLPYKNSFDEWYRRRVDQVDFHRRLYGRHELSQLLKRHGFYPLDLRFQTFVPNRVDNKSTHWAKRLIAAIRYPSFRHSVICCVAQKMTVM